MMNWTSASIHAICTDTVNIYMRIDFGCKIYNKVQKSSKVMQNEYLFLKKDFQSGNFCFK